MNIETIFPSKIIVKDLSEKECLLFLSAFIKNVWLDHDLPGGMRKVGDGKKLTLEHLPKDFDSNAFAKRAVEKKQVLCKKIGIVDVNIDLVINIVSGVNPGYKIEINKFVYEVDGHNLLQVVKKTISEL